MTEILLIIGAQKTGTSSMVGLLNCHPEIFVAPEWFANKRTTKYGLRFFQKYKIPDRERFKKRKPIRKNFIRFNNKLQTAGFDYSYVGDKWPSCDLGSLRRTKRRMEEINECHSIFMVRDIRTWLCHGIVNHLYHVDENVIPAAVKYVEFLIRSFKLDKCLRVRMEDYRNPEEVVSSVSEFLGLKDDGYMQDWWAKADKPLDELKAMHPWWERHVTALRPLEKADIEVEIDKSHHFWKKILPIFDKYYNNASGVFSDQELDKDIRRLRSMLSKDAVELKDCYKSIRKNKIR